MSGDGVVGMVPVELARDAVGLARACEIHGASFFGNGARPGVVLETDATLTPEAAQMLRENWERVHRGADRSNRTAVLQGGLKAHELGGNNHESQFLESRRFQVEEICRLFRVPPHLVGDLTRSSFSNIEQQSIDFVQHTLLPWLRRFETTFARDLITDNKTYFAEFDTRGLLRGDAAARGSYYQTLWGLGVASVNEIRSWENLNPVDGGDARFVPLNFSTLQTDKADESQPDTPAAATGDDSEKVADTAFTGVQISSLVDIALKVSLGELPRESGISIILASFPSLSREQAEDILPVAIEQEQPSPTLEPDQEGNDGEV
jgi:hypothetical protein